MSSARLLCIAAVVATGAASFAQPPSPLPAPPDRAAVKRMFDPLRTPVPPRHLIANIYYVGASGVSSFLITSPQGHILLDTGFEDTVPLILRGVEQLGFKPTDIKLVLSSHALIDLVGGHALMKKRTGARVVASAADARTLESGGEDDFIQWPKDTILYAPVKVDRIVADGERVTLGGTALTAHLTPGHTRGATTWTMDVTEGEQTRHVVFFSSTTVNAGTRLLNNPLFPDIVEQYEATFAKLKALPCDIFFAPHGYQFGMTDKFARIDRGEKENPLIDPAGWRQLIIAAERTYRAQLSLEHSLAPR